ncbi:FAD:protein FMN transferase [Stratiformator vulcanicus]|uniref:FAD:protein FMN transferase n=1 Tax=Stratiformator vulcanicus TaxID=2527980 RepID=A0A517R4W6_9PLAN|nr:FAD:protein FMN transferase [Stratiformator vulcanicus]QDT38927.1 Thiamine biosynthesis lipoprotein ApbE precursor [Stratiformator vulcanicus]
MSAPLLRLTRFLPFAVVAAALFYLAFFGNERPATLAFRGETMGTTYEVKVYSAEGSKLQAAQQELKQQADRLLETINDQMSTWWPDSELSRFNRAAGDEPFEVSPATALVVQEAIRVSRLSGGAFDPTVGPLVNLWSFGPEGRPEEIPDDEQIAEARSSIGTDMVEVNDDPPTLTKRSSATELDLSAIAKGYGVDAIGELLLDRGYDNWLVEIGGEIRASGFKKNSDPWVIAVEKPVAGERAIEQVVELPTASGGAMATSGDYRNFFEQDGVRYSHTIDPRTGRPISHRLVSVSVIHKSCMTADALATAVMVLGPDEGYNLLESEGVAALLISRGEDGFVTRATSTFPR